MVRRRARAAGITTEVCNHTFRGTGITAYLENGGTLEKARQMAAHASTRTTQLYDRLEDRVTLDEVVKINIHTSRTTVSAFRAGHRVSHLDPTSELAGGVPCEPRERVPKLMGLRSNQERKRLRSSLLPSISIRPARMASPKVSLANHMRIMVRISVVM